MISLKNTDTTQSDVATSMFSFNTWRVKNFLVANVFPFKEKIETRKWTVASWTGPRSLAIFLFHMGIKLSWSKRLTTQYVLALTDEHMKLKSSIFYSYTHLLASDIWTRFRYLRIIPVLFSSGLLQLMLNSRRWSWVSIIYVIDAARLHVFHLLMFGIASWTLLTFFFVIHNPYHSMLLSFLFDCDPCFLSCTSRNL